MAHLIRDAGPLPALPGTGRCHRVIQRGVIPGLRAEQPPVRRARGVLVHQVHADADLAVPDLAQRAGILPGHARRRTPVLGEPGVIDHQRLHRLAGGEPPRHVPPHSGVIPGRGRDELLQPLMIYPQPRRHRLHRLTLPIGQQPSRIQLAFGALIPARQVAQHLRGERRQPGPDHRNLLRSHAGITPRNPAAIPDLSSVEITTVPNGDLRIPPLGLKGDYSLGDIRLTQGDRVLAYAAHRNASITVTDVLITQVTSRPLTYEELVDKGVVTAPGDFTGFGRLSKTTDPAGNTVEYSYDAGGNRSSAKETGVSSVDGSTRTYVTSFEYDQDNRVKKVTDPLGHFTSTTYDPRGYTLTETDEDGNVISYKYDDAGQRTEIDRPQGIVTKFSFDGNGNVTKVTDASSRVTAYAYDGQGRPASITYPDGKEIDYSHDEDGRVVAQTENGGSSVAFTYDASGRPLSRTFTKGPGVEGPDSETFTFDFLGRMISAGNGESHIDLSYDSLDRPTSETLTVGGTSYPVAVNYDAAGNEVSRTLPSGRTVSKTVDVLDRVRSIQDGALSFATFDYQGRAETIRKTLGNNLAETFAYDPARRLTEEAAAQPSSAAVLDHKYGWTNSGRRSFTTLTNGKTDLYGYDYAQRLTSETLGSPDNPPLPTGTPDATKAFVYDGTNGLTSIQDSRVGFLAGSTDMGNRTTALGSMSFGWDSQGNLFFEIHWRPDRLRRGPSPRPDHAC